LKEFGRKIGSLNDYQKARDILFGNTHFVDEFISSNGKFTNEHIGILKNIKTGIKDSFIYLKTLKKHSLLLSSSTNKIYCVLGINDPLDEIIPCRFAVVETAIINYLDQIVCDGLITHSGVTIGPNMRKDINVQYKKAKENKELIQRITRLL